MGLYSNSIVKDDLEEIINGNVDLKKFDNSSILITGATGMIASYIVFVLARMNIEYSYHINIYALGRNKVKAQNKFSELWEYDFFKFIEQDVSNPIDIDSDVDYVIHAASNASPKYMLNDPVGIAKANILGMYNVAEFARTHNTQQIHFLSTREVYGDQENKVNSINETEFGILNPLQLRAVYPETKRAAETLLSAYQEQYGLDFTISRIAHSYGPGMSIKNDGRIMADLINNVVSGEPIVLKSEGLAERAFLYINDAVTGILTIMTKGKSGEAYNLANEKEPIKIRDLADMLTQIFPERSEKIDFQINKSNMSGYSQFIRVPLSTDRLEKIGWDPQTSLDSGLKKTIKSFLLEY
ncbi:NAD-dependent epimerase/dehydratase family protein [Latilactobacillus sakei]